LLRSPAASPFPYTTLFRSLADRIRGEEPFVQQFPGGERILTLAEVQDVQRLLMAQGFHPGGADGRIGPETVAAVRAYQLKVGSKDRKGTRLNSSHLPISYT